MRLLEDANITVLRRVVKENKNLIASFFVDESGEHSDKKCFDIILLTKKLAKGGIPVPQNYSDKISLYYYVLVAFHMKSKRLREFLSQRLFNP